jgi:DNA-binding MarR family transcriptional regulator
MGLNRQGVQRIANELAVEGLVAYQDNPNHSRAKLVIITRKGKAAYEAATALQLPWVNTLSEGLKAQELAAARAILEMLRTRLE